MRYTGLLFLLGGLISPLGKILKLGTYFSLNFPTRTVIFFSAWFYLKRYIIFSFINNKYLFYLEDALSSNIVISCFMITIINLVSKLYPNKKGTLIGLVSCMFPLAGSYL